MKQNKLAQFGVLIVLFIVLFFIGSFFKDDENTQKNEQVATKTTTKPSVTATKNHTDQAIAFDYDNVMANDRYGQNKHANVDYYALVLSWSPAFCDLQRNKNHGNLSQSLQYQCGGNEAFGWVVHGLWPQNANARSISDHPRFCQGDLPVLPESLIKQYLNISPGAALLQGEWEKHGACAFKSAEQYFAQEESLFNSLKFPTKQLNRNELFRWMRQNNPSLNNVYMNATKTELYICYDKSWQPINCPQNTFN